MQTMSRAGLITLAMLVQVGSGWAQAVPARLTLYDDPTPATSEDQLVLGRTTLAEARRLFPNAPTHKGPMAYPGNPSYLQHEPDVELAGAVIKFRHTFWLGQGQGILIFDEHQRLVGIDHGPFAWADPVTGESMIEIVAWKATDVSRNDFRQRYPKARGWWMDPVHYHIEGEIAECVAVAASFVQVRGQDELGTLGYRYICPTRGSEAR
jgi:hypothetical protein